MSGVDREAIAYQCRLFYSPLIALSEKHATPVYGLVFGLVDKAARPQAISAPSMEDLIGGIIEVAEKKNGVEQQQIPLGLALWRSAFGKSVTREQAHAPAVLMLDLDVAEAGHKDKKKPLPSRAEAEAIIAEIEEELGLAFSAIAESNGSADGSLHAYLATREPVTAELLARWKSFVSERFSSRGLHVDKLSGGGQQMMGLIGTTHLTSGLTRRWLTATERRYSIRLISKKLEGYAGATEDAEPVNLIDGTRTWEAPEGYYARVGRIGAPLKGRPGDAFDALIDPLSFLGEFYPVIDGTFARPDGTVGSEKHAKLLPNGRLVIWGERLADASGLERGSEHTYSAFSIICNGFYGGDFTLTAFMLGYLYRRTGGGEAWVRGVIEFIRKNPSASAAYATLPKKKG